MTGGAMRHNGAHEIATPALPLTILQATPADVDEVTRVYIDSWNAGFGELLSQADRTVTPDLVERWSHDLARPAPHRWWVAERMGSIVGVVGIGPSRDPVDSQLGELDTIAVDPPHWRTGIGRALMSLALQSLVSDGYSEAIRWKATNEASLSTKLWGGGETVESETRADRYVSGETWLSSSEIVAAGSENGRACVTISGVCGS